MSDQASPLDVLNYAFQQAKANDWRAAQELCAVLGNHAPPLGVIARLNILICQYHLGHTQLIPERVLPLLGHLPPPLWPACIGLSLLAARKNNSLPDFKHLVLALADPRNQALDLPTVPTFVMLESDMATYRVVESADGALMSEIVQKCSDAKGLTEEEKHRLLLLASRYRERASITAASYVNEANRAKDSGNQSKDNGGNSGKS